MRCNCQMSFSSSFERPRFKLRSHRKRMDNTTIIGRPMASVARTMVKNSESRAVRDCVIGSLQMQASGGRIQQRGSDDTSKKQGLVFVYRWRERKSDGGYTKRSQVIGSVSMLKTEANAWRVIEHRKLDVNSDHLRGQTVTIGLLVNRYLETELAELRHSTANAYKSYLTSRIKPRWGNYPISKVKPFAVEQWLKGLDLAPRTRGHIHNLMRVLLNCAMRWELTEIGENPMKLVRVRGTSKRQREPVVLSVTQFHLLLEELDEPFRTMVILDLATGLRCSELFALKWCDVLWDDLTLLVRRGIVTGVVSDVKTKYSRAGMPLDP